MPYQNPAALRTALEARLRNEALERGMELARLRRRAVFERLLVRLEVTGPGIWVLKGGAALEVRWRERARTTRDLDLALRERPVDGEALHELLVAQLSEDPDGDGFRFDVEPPSALPDDVAGRPAWRFAARSLLAGREFARVKVDVVARSEELVATERLTLPGVLAFAGFPQHDVEAVALAQHFAEKLHALTRRYPDRENSRVRDLVDLLLLIENGLLNSAEVLKIAMQVLAARGTHDLPGHIPGFSFSRRSMTWSANERSPNASFGRRSSRRIGGGTGPSTLPMADRPVTRFSTSSMSSCCPICVI